MQIELSIAELIAIRELLDRERIRLERQTPEAGQEWASLGKPGIAAWLEAQTARIGALHDRVRLAVKEGNRLEIEACKAADKADSASVRGGA